MILVNVKRPLSRPICYLRRSPNCVQLHSRARRCHLAMGQGNSRQQATRHVSRKRRASLRLSLVRHRRIEHHEILRHGYYRRRLGHRRDTHQRRRWRRQYRRQKFRPRRGSSHKRLNHKGRHGRKCNHRTLRLRYAKCPVHVTNRGDHRRVGNHVYEHLFQFAFVHMYVHCMCGGHTLG